MNVDQASGTPSVEFVALQSVRASNVIAEVPRQARDDSKMRFAEALDRRL
ncbi:MAG: hypothetical protein ACI8UO_002245, partial [Verrucomicrobiales bacterium]